MSAIIMKNKYKLTNGINSGVFLPKNMKKAYRIVFKNVVTMILRSDNKCANWLLPQREFK